MMTSARVVLVCFLVSTCLLKHTLSLPLAPVYEGDAFNEVDFEEEIPNKDYDNVDEDPDFNPDYYYEEDDDFEDGDFEDDDFEEGDYEDDDDGGKYVEEEEDDDGNKEDLKHENRIKRDLDGVNGIDEEFDPEEEELKAIESEGDPIPVAKDVGTKPNFFDDHKNEDFDEVLRDYEEPVDGEEVDESKNEEESSDIKESLPSRDDEFQEKDEPDSKDVNEMDVKGSKSCKDKESDTKEILPL